MNKKHVWSRQRIIWSIRRKNTSGLDKNQHSSGLYDEKHVWSKQKNTSGLHEKTLPRYYGPRPQQNEKNHATSTEDM